MRSASATARMRIALDVARARHRSGRRGHHDAAIGGVLCAGHHDGRRETGVRGHRSRTADARSRCRRRGGHAADRGDPAGAPLRSVRGHDRHRRRAAASQSGARRGRCQAHSRPARDGRSAASASPPPSVSIRRRTSARSATAARSSTNDEAIAARAKRLRNGGQTDQYRHPEFGVNSRLDEMQAAILRARSPFLGRWTERRRVLAAGYRRPSRA